jgi:hypothetical protein
MSVGREGLASVIAGLGEREATGVEHGMPCTSGNRRVWEATSSGHSCRR